MIHTFLVSIDTGTDLDLVAIADEISEALESQFDVQSVKPWSQHGETSVLPPPLSIQPPSTQS